MVFRLGGTGKERVYKLATQPLTRFSMPDNTKKPRVEPVEKGPNKGKD